MLTFQIIDLLTSCRKRNKIFASFLRDQMAKHMIMFFYDFVCVPAAGHGLRMKLSGLWLGSLFFLLFALRQRKISI